MPRPAPSSGSSVVSCDCGCLNRLDDVGPKLTALFVCDQHYIQNWSMLFQLPAQEVVI